MAKGKMRDTVINVMQMIKVFKRFIVYMNGRISFIVSSEEKKE
jgi:hypothetical protein